MQQRSKEELLAAAERFSAPFSPAVDGTRDLNENEIPTDSDWQLVATILREHAAGMDGFEAWADAKDPETTDGAFQQHAFLAGRASAQADLDALVCEVYRLRDGLDEYWNNLPENVEPQRVRDILAARRKEV